MLLWFTVTVVVEVLFRTPAALQTEGRRYPEIGAVAFAYLGMSVGLAILHGAAGGLALGLSDRCARSLLTGGGRHRTARIVGAAVIAAWWIVVLAAARAGFERHPPGLIQGAYTYGRLLLVPCALIAVCLCGVATGRVRQSQSESRQHAWRGAVTWSIAYFVAMALAIVYSDMSDGWHPGSWLPGWQELAYQLCAAGLAALLLGWLVVAMSGYVYRDTQRGKPLRASVAKAAVMLWGVMSLALVVIMASNVIPFTNLRPAAPRVAIAVLIAMVTAVVFAQTEVSAPRRASRTAAPGSSPGTRAATS